MDNKYIIVKGSNGKNIWKIIGDIERLNSYIIQTRRTTTIVEKNLCKNKEGSSLLIYEGKNLIDILPSDIEIEKWSYYENYLLHNMYEEDLKV